MFSKNIRKDRPSESPVDLRHDLLDKISSKGIEKEMCILETVSIKISKDGFETDTNYYLLQFKIAFRESQKIQNFKFSK